MLRAGSRRERHCIVEHGGDDGILGVKDLRGLVFVLMPMDSKDSETAHRYHVVLLLLLIVSLLAILTAHIVLGPKWAIVAAIFGVAMVGSFVLHSN
jgi:hypothetical protein